MEYLSDEAIIKIIDAYLTEDIYAYAIMIDGEWGSGKTYFVKSKLIPEIKQLKPDRNAVYISLYGLKCAEDIANRIYMSTIENKVMNGKKVIPMLNIATKVIFDIIGDKAGSDTLSGMDLSTFFPLISYKESYFLFDDLERCSIPINDVLGYLNNFTEQNKAKVVIIANEKEIGSIDTHDNYGMNLLISTMNTIDWPKEEEKGSFRIRPAGNSISDTPISLTELIRRKELLTNARPVYMLLKEKLIGKTLHYKPNLQSAVDDILVRSQIAQLVDEDFTRVIRDKICMVMEFENNLNLRTVQFGLAFFRKITENLEASIRSSSLCHEILETILIAILKVSISYKNGEKPYEWLENREYDSIRLKQEFVLRNYFISFRFIHDYVYHGAYDQKRISQVLNYYFENLLAEKSKPNDPIYKLQNFMVLEDKVILENIDSLLNNLKEGNYGGNLYREILSLLYKVKETSLQVPVNDFFSIMKERVQSGESISDVQTPFIGRNLKYKDEFNDRFNELSEIEKNKRIDSFKEVIDQMMSFDSDWPNDLNEYYMKDNHVFTMKRGFFKFIDIDSLGKVLFLASPKQLVDFRNIVEEIYSFSNISEFFDEDIENINKLSSMINESNHFESRIHQFNLNYLHESLENILKHLKKSNPTEPVI